MSRPDKLPSWCDDDNSGKVTEPSDTKKLQGWLYRERPAFDFWNWIFRHFVKWFNHIDESVNHFDAHAAATPDMTVVITAGRVQNGTTLTDVAEQTTSAFTAPSGNPRIDRIVIDNVTGAYSVIAGSEAASPVALSLTVGKIAVCQVLLQTTSAEITSDMITDERSVVQQTPELQTKVIEIGTWDMTAATGVGTVSIAHGLTFSKIRSAKVLIRNDGDTTRYDFPTYQDSVTSGSEYIFINATNVGMIRATGGTFDAAVFDTMGDDGNRGWIIIQYEG